MGDNFGVKQMTKLIIPVGTPEGAVVGVNGVPHVICAVQDPCANSIAPSGNYTYLDANGNPTNVPCDAVSIEADAAHICGCTTVCTFVPAGVVTADHTPLFVDEYPNDGSPLLDLAAAGAIFVGNASPFNSCGGGYYDNRPPTAPAGYVAVNLTVADANTALAAAA